MNAQDFLNQYNAVMNTTWDEDAPKTRGDWTKHMVKRLHALAAASGLICICQHQHIPMHSHVSGQQEHTPEVLFDFCWYTGEGYYSLPSVIIEHENGIDLNSFLYDHWKLLMGWAPLRVMIGYAPKTDDWPRYLDTINQYARDSRWTFPAGTEDLVLLGPCASSFSVGSRRCRRKAIVISAATRRAS